LAARICYGPLEPHLLQRRDHDNALEKSVQLVNGFDRPYVARCPIGESAEFYCQATQQRFALAFEQTDLSSLLASLLQSFLDSPLLAFFEKLVCLGQLYVLHVAELLSRN